MDNTLSIQSLSNIIQQTTLLQTINHLSTISNASPPKLFLSPDSKRITQEKRLFSSNDLKSPTDLLKQKKLNHALFTIQQNYYTRKNQHLLSPRPPKYKAPAVRLALYNQIDLLQRNREKKVLFNDNLTKEDKSIASKKQSLSSKSAKPIIKNMLTHKQDNLSNSSKSISVQNSFVSQFNSKTKKDRVVRIDNNKQKYKQILNHFQRNREIREQRNKNKFARQIRQKTIQKQEKYVDNIFPPVNTSIFQNPNKNSHFSSQIKWKRLSDFYSKQDVVVLSKSGVSQIRIILQPHSHSSQFVAIAFNALKHSTCILQRIFQQQTFNQYGLYLVRIFQQSNWKSVILDQYIPIIEHQNDEATTPAFITVQKQPNGQIQLWPFLLQKAFAHYYSAYQLLRYGSTIDFLNQTTGLCPVEIILKKKSQKQYTNLQANLESVDSFAIGEFSNTKKQLVLRLRYETSQIVYSQAPNFTQSYLTQQTFATLSKIYLYSPKSYHTLSTNTIGKYSLSHHHERAEYSIRKLVLTQNSDCIVSLQQKQSRFFKKSSLDYHYLWARVLLVQREFNGYRWIQGKYSNQKSITLNASLSQGEYYLIIMPQWKDTQNFELTLLVWGNHHIGIDKQKGSCEEMIEQASMDLAQRKGKINQLSTTLCSYNYVCSRTGMIIENINNEKLKQQIQVHRNISGIPCSVKLLPINKAFWPEKGKMITQIDVIIPKLSSYTIVLKMKGGMDYKLIQYFSAQKQNK